jgi:hypothetical protein
MDPDGSAVLMPADSQVPGLSKPHISFEVVAM